MARPKSRPQQWQEAASQAINALSDLQSLQQEYQDWLDNLPENLQSGNLAAKLEEVTNLDIEGALDTVQEAEGMDLPLGFGRD